MVEVVSTNFSARFVRISEIFANSRQNCGATRRQILSSCRQLRRRFYALKNTENCIKIG